MLLIGMSVVFSVLLLLWGALELFHVVVTKLPAAIEKKRESLTAKAFTADRIKTDAPDIFETIDKIGRSIEEKKKIAFQYIDYLPDKTLILRHDKKEYKVSPMVMIWNDDRYYARCIDPDKPI